LPNAVIAQTRDSEAVPEARCRNCETPLTGPYCSGCGQSARSRVLSLGHLIQEAVGDLFHLDSRLWSTLRLLLLRPGQLTVEYLAGRRARYMPPFRLYLVLSVLLFVLTRHLPGVGGAPIVFEDPAAAPGLYAATEAALAAKRVELERTGASEALREQVAELSQRLDQARAAQALAKTKSDNGCDALRFSFFGSKALESRVRAACHKITADEGASLVRAVLDNLPKMMFVFLPILALVNKILYLRSRRYYVEHLLYFVHVHVFVFLVLCAIIIGNGLFALVPGGVHPPAIVSAAVWIAMFAYVFLALRRVYGQGRVKTFIKFGFLLVAYIISLGLTTIATVVYSAMTL
jgi:hypothetical protein